MLKRLTLIGIPLIAVVCFALAPFYYLELIKWGFEEGNMETLNFYVDWDSVREDVAVQVGNLTDIQAKSARAPQSVGDAFAQAFGDGLREMANGFKNVAVAAAVESVVTPEAITGIYHGQMPDLGDDFSNALASPLWRYATNDLVLSNSNSRARLAARLSFEPYYASFSEFAIPVFYQLEQSGPPMRVAEIVMERNGWIFWKVTHVVFEDDVRAVIARATALRVAEQQRLQRARDNRARLSSMMAGLGEAARRLKASQEAEAQAAAAAAQTVDPDVVAESTPPADVVAPTPEESLADQPAAGK